MGTKKDDRRKRRDLRKGSEKEELEQGMIRLSLVIVSQYLSR